MFLPGERNQRQWLRRSFIPLSTLTTLVSSLSDNSTVLTTADDDGDNNDDDNDNKINEEVSLMLSA